LNLFFATEFPPCSYRIFILRWLTVSSLTNNRTIENELHAAGAQLAVKKLLTHSLTHSLILNKQHGAIIRL